MTPRIPGSREELELKVAEANRKVSIGSHWVIGPFIEIVVVETNASWINKIHIIDASVGAKCHFSAPA